MKRVLRLIAASLTMTSLFVGTGHAQSTITGTGPGSTNVITNSSTTSITSSCTNSATILNSNPQTATSGTAVVSGNNTGGNATSGSASNSSVTTTAVSASCGPVASLATTNPIPAGGAGGSGSRVAFTTAGTTSYNIAMLPDTGPRLAVLKNIAIGAAVVTGFSLLAQGLLQNYRQQLMRLA